MSVAALILWAAGIWLSVGCLVALAFLMLGADRVLEDARGVYLFRVLVAPGIVLLWPIVLWRWYVREKGALDWRDHHQPRRRLAGHLELAMAAALLVLLALAAVLASDPAAPPEPLRLSEALAPQETAR